MIAPSRINGFVVTIKGLYDEIRIGFKRKIDPEINRWIIKALIEIGSYSDSEWFKNKAASCTDEENFVWIAIGVIKFSLDYESIKNTLEKMPLTNPRVNLAICMAKRFEYLSDSLGINIENSSKIDLLIACIAFGLRRDLDRVFDPKFSQIEQLTKLNLHDDEHIMQYSIYAMWRLPEVSFKHSEFLLHDIASKANSVRRWSYELILKEENSFKDNLDFWRQVAEQEDSEEAMEGFANGIANQFVDGAPDIVLSIFNQSTERVKLGLLRHICNNSEEDQSYREIAVSEFQNAGRDSLIRAVCLDAAIGRELWPIFKKIELSTSSYDLFGNGDIVMGDKINIGNVENFSKGDHNVLSSGTLYQEIKNNEIDIEKLIAAITAGGQSREEFILRDDLNEVRSNPDKNLIRRVVDGLKTVAAGVGSTKEIVDAAGPLLDSFQSLV